MGEALDPTLAALIAGAVFIALCIRAGLWITRPRAPEPDAEPYGDVPNVGRRIDR